MISRAISNPRNRRISLASGAGLAQRLVQLLTTLITLPLMLHSLGVAGFGVWGAATSLAWLSGMLDFGLGSALVTLLPQSLAIGQPDLARSYVAASLLGALALSTIVIGVEMIALAIGGMRMLSAPFLIAGIAISLNIPLNISCDIWFALQKGYIVAAWQTVQIFLTLVFLISASLAGSSLNIMVSGVYAAMLFANFASITHVLVSNREIFPNLWPN